MGARSVCPIARIAVFTHPLGGLSDPQLIERALTTVREVARATAEDRRRRRSGAAARSQRLQAPADPAQLQAWFFERRLERWISGDRADTRSGRRDGRGLRTSRAGSSSGSCRRAVARLPSSRSRSTPSWPAAGRSICRFCRRRSMRCSSRASTWRRCRRPRTRSRRLLIVHGPIAKALHMNAGAGTFGPGSMANAVIGRAIRLILWNIGGAVAGAVDRSTQGSPEQIQLLHRREHRCLALGFLRHRARVARGSNAVTVFGG